MTQMPSATQIYADFTTNIFRQVFDYQCVVKLYNLLIEPKKKSS